MISSLHLLSNNIPGYGTSDSACFPCVCRAVGVRPILLQSGYRNPVCTRSVLLTCASKRVSIVCRAGSNGRRNPDYPRQNRQVYSRNGNRNSEERDNSEHYEDSDYFSSKNGPLLSLANNPKFQATAAPGPREREIVELFRRVQAQLRERAAAKEDKKIEGSKGQSKESDTVDSLLKLLRKHSAEQGKRKVNGCSGRPEFSFDQPGCRNTSFDEDKGKTFFSADSIVRDEAQAPSSPSRRPMSVFRRRSPVPRVKYEPVVSAKEPIDLNEKRVKTRSMLVPEPDSDPESESDVEAENELEVDSVLQSEPVLEPETSFRDDRESSDLLEVGSAGEMDEESDADEYEVVEAEEEEEEEEQSTGALDLNAMKLPELRALAKARGVKGFSKLKKSELIGLLSDDSM